VSLSQWEMSRLQQELLSCCRHTFPIVYPGLASYIHYARIYANAPVFNESCVDGIQDLGSSGQALPDLLDGIQGRLRKECRAHACDDNLPLEWPTVSSEEPLDLVVYCQKSPGSEEIFLLLQCSTLWLRGFSEEGINIVVNKYPLKKCMMKWERNLTSFQSVLSQLL